MFLLTCPGATCRLERGRWTVCRWTFCRRQEPPAEGSHIKQQGKKRLSWVHDPAVGCLVPRLCFAGWPQFITCRPCSAVWHRHSQCQHVANPDDREIESSAMPQSRRSRALVSLQSSGTERCATKIHAITEGHVHLDQRKQPHSIAATSNICTKTSRYFRTGLQELLGSKDASCPGRRRHVEQHHLTTRGTHRTLTQPSGGCHFGSLAPRTSTKFSGSPPLTWSHQATL